MFSSLCTRMAMWRFKPLSMTPSVCVRCKTTRPMEWKDEEKFKPVIDPKQREKPRDYYTPEPWMRVKWKGLDVRERKVHAIATNDTLRSDPREAAMISMEKLQSFQRSITAKGFSREQEPYQPREDVQEVIQSVAKQVFGQSASSDSWLEISLEDHLLKFKFLQLCASKVDYEVPNAILFQMKTVQDVVAFYQTPVEGNMPYNKLLKSQEKGELPPNLSALDGPIVWDPSSDFMEGVDAFPGIYFQRQGIRFNKKYPKLKKKIHWPDI